MEVRKPEEPAVSSDLKFHSIGAFVLSKQPTKVRVVDNPRDPADPLQFHSDPGAQKSFHCKKCHLSIIGDGSAPPVGWGVITYTARTELVPYLREREKLDWRSQCISDSTAQ
jgi:hypothetical protein